jgi:hypothetical protein
MAAKVFHARAQGTPSRRSALCGLSGLGLKFRTGSGVTCTLCLVVRSRGGGSR